MGGALRLGFRWLQRTVPHVIFDPPNATTVSHPNDKISARRGGRRLLTPLIGAVPGSGVDGRVSTKIEMGRLHGMSDLPILRSPGEESPDLFATAHLASVR
jgi:hypothetical protein